MGLLLRALPATAKKKPRPGPGFFLNPPAWGESESLGDHAHKGALIHALLAERHTAFGRGEQRVIAAHAHVVAGVIDGTTLTHDDVAGQHMLTAELLHAKTLGL